MHFATVRVEVACSAFDLPKKKPSKLRAKLKHEGLIFQISSAEQSYEGLAADSRLEGIN
jgi:hypothetical protein